MGARIACVLVIACAIGCGSPSRAPVDASDDQPTPDAPAEPAAFGEACSKHTDCRTGFCVEPVGNTGGVCTRTCKDEACPTGWECRNVELPQVELELCVPAAQQLCLACVNDAECGGGACLDIDGGGRCATPCTDVCPTGYTCVADASGAHPGKFCQPVTASCTCSDGMQGATRSCSNTSAIGTCFGTQMCDAATGWSACTALTPADETCDGVDNDCDFIIDDGVGGGEACTNTVNGIGSCPGVRACDGSAGFVCVGKTPMMESCNFADDDCDDKVDEGYPGLGQSCTAGIGACTRYGSQRCNTAGNGLVCSAVAGQPGTEACNQIDDDCDSKTDETFKMGAAALGTQCVAGLGVCASYGTYVCRGDGTGTQCSATPGTNSSSETCNYLDDNCDGTVDNGFRNTATGSYDTDQNCGSCGNDCTTLYTAQNSYGACAVTTSAQCVMRCNPGTGNLNGSTFDGCEFVLDANAIYVSTTDTTAVDDSTCGLGPTGTGTGNHPCKTIGMGLSRSVTTGRSKVLVADGTYNEGVTLVNAKNLMGGYRADTWERHLSTTSTVIAGATSVGNHDRTVAAVNITVATLFEGFVVRGSFNTKPSGNSYAIYVSGSNASLVIRDNKIFAGRGGEGAAGMPGTNGLSGSNGGGRSSGMTDNNYDAKSVNGCDSSTTTITAVRGHDNGGYRSCGGTLVSGGAGGGNRCPPSSAANSPNPGPAEQSGRDGFNGLSAAGGGAAGTGNDAGDDGYVYNNATRCTIPGAPTFGLDGNPGTSGSAATGVAGCSNASGTVSGGEWLGGAGAPGNGGTHGGGGGGGGAGGGGYCYDCNSNPAMIGGNHRIGGHGGGGGSGGCGGAGGGAGEPGGGVFGIFITGGSAPTITNNAITRGNGGNGGNGGIGGAGGLGGNGGAGGQSDLFCTDKAGRGGDGGAGGAGSGGGGGCGGSSFGIFTSGIGSPSYCTNNTVSGGSAGGGGAGGFSGGNSGGSGTTGVLQACTSI